MSRVCETSVILILLALCTAVLTQLGIAFWSNRSPFIFLGIKVVMLMTIGMITFDF